MLPHIVGFLAMACIPLVLAGYGGHLAAMVLEEKKRRKALRIVWGFAILGIIMAGLQQWLNYKSEAELRGRLDSIENTGKAIASDIKTFSKKESSETKIVSIPPRKPNKQPEKQKKIEDQRDDLKDKESLKNIEKGISELKGLVAEQKWGLSAEQLISLSRRISVLHKPEDTGDLITCVLGDPDSTKFAVNLVGAFEVAGWRNSLSQAIFSGNPTGIIIKLNSQQSDPPGLREFVGILREAGIEPTGEVDSKVPSDHFKIIVGRKPEKH